MKVSSSFLRNFIFGVEDSLVSTVGLLSGIAIASVPRKTIFLTGVILILVEAFSMAVGSFLSERAVDDYLEHKEVPSKAPFIGGVIMFFSYFVSGFIPLFPYVILRTEFALIFSIAVSSLALLLLGFFSAKISGTNYVRSGLRMFVMGSVAVVVGILAGRIIGQ